VRIYLCHCFADRRTAEEVPKELGIRCMRVCILALTRWGLNVICKGGKHDSSILVISVVQDTSCFGEPLRCYGAAAKSSIKTFIHRAAVVDRHYITGCQYAKLPVAYKEPRQMLHPAKTRQQASKLRNSPVLLNDMDLSWNPSQVLPMKFENS